MMCIDPLILMEAQLEGSFVPIERYARQFRSLFELVDRAAPPFIEELDYVAREGPIMTWHRME